MKVIAELGCAGGIEGSRLKWVLDVQGSIYLLARGLFFEEAVRWTIQVGKCIRSMIIKYKRRTYTGTSHTIDE